MRGRGVRIRGGITVPTLKRSLSVFSTTAIIGASLAVAAVGVAAVAGPQLASATAGVPAALQVNTNSSAVAQGGVRDFAVSGNGRYVTFNGAPDQFGAGCALTANVCGTRLYAKDLATGAVAPVGDPATAGQYPNANAYASAMDFTGRFVVFVSTASNLVPGQGAAGSVSQLFVRDRDTDGNGIFDEAGKSSLKLLSRQWEPTTGPGAIQSTGVDINGVGISSNGRYVTYVTTDGASQVVRVVDRNYDSNGHMDDDHDTWNRPIASFTGTGPLSITDLSPDGRFVVVAPRAGGSPQIIIDRDSDHNGVYDEKNTVTTSSLPAGLQAISITGDGRKVLVQTNTSFSAADNSAVASGDGYVYDRDADGNGVFGEVGAGKASYTLVTQRTDGSLPSGGAVQRVAEGMSRDGRFVLFSSQAVDPVTHAVVGDGYTADDNNGVDDHYVRDLATKTLTRISDVASGFATVAPTANFATRVGRTATLEGNVAVFNVIKGTTTDTWSQAVGGPRTWSVSGPAGSNVTNDGSKGHPQVTYNVNLGNPGAGVTDRTWTFQNTATVAGSVDVPYTYAGFHATKSVSVHLNAFLVHNGATATVPLVAAGPANSGSMPSGGFSYTGDHVFDVQVGDTFGYTFGGSNTDANSQLNGVVTLSPQPFTPTAPQTAFQTSALTTVADNTSWVNATAIGSGPVTGALLQPGEARWYKFPVIPSSQVQVELGNLPQNYDLTMYGDIGAAFKSLTSTQDLTKLSAQFAGSAYAPSIYSPSIYSPSIYSPSIYSPSIYSPSIYSPSIYSPSIYSPSIYSPSIYSPSIYSPSIYSPSIYSPSIYSPSIYSPTDAFTQAFSSAQTRSLLAVSANEGTAPESIRVSTWNNTGYFYVRVLGRNGASDPATYSLGLTSTGGPCDAVTLSTHADDLTMHGIPGSAQTVILTDSSRWGSAAPGIAGLRAELDLLAGSTGGVVVDVSASTKVNNLNAQADGAPGCPYAKNLVAQAIRDIVNTYRDNSKALKYVVLVGGDTVIPFFRYADAAGIGPESDYVPPVQDVTPAQASLRSNDVFGQDAYGSLVDLPLQGGLLPVPDLAVGRLVETPTEIEGTIDAYLHLATPGVLPTPSSSLVTGYDFLTSAADSVNGTFSAGIGAAGDALITDQGVPTSVTTDPAMGPTRSTSWTAADFTNALEAKHHDLLFLAGHFSANSTLAADYSTSYVTNQLDLKPGLLTNSLVISAGCHSAYNIQDGDGIPYLTNGLDWAEEMAKQQATFVGGTGYQYADTDFLAYSAKLYTQMAQQLLVGSGPVSVGSALVKAKQAYLAGLANVSGIDQKTLIESTVYGLPMVGVNMPTGRTRAPAVTTGGTLNPNPVSAGTPGGQLGLQTVPYDLSPVLDADNPAYPNTTGHAWTKSAGDPVTGTASSTILQWHTGRDGVQSGAGLPTLPKQIDDVTSTNGSVLRGVGFRSGSYTDSGHITPLTGAPTTEQDGIHTSFAAAAFFPQKLTSVNYFDALGNPVAGTTKLVTTPVQYRAEVGASTDTERVYQHLGLSLFYSSNIDKYGQNTPALAAPPSITGVSASSSADGGSVSVTAHITGDPSAGVQQVWVTYTGEAGPFQGTWASIDLAQDSTDSTLWFGRITLPAGQRASDVRLILQAVNGVGVVGLDNNFGDGYIPNVPVGSIVRTASLPAGLALDTPVPTGGQLGTTVSVGATLTGAPVGSPVVFSIASASATAFTADLGGHVTTTLRLLDHVGPYALTASYAGDNTHVPASASSPFSIDRLPTTLKLSVVAQSKTAQASAVLTGPAGELLAHQSVILSITGPGHPAATPLQFALTTDGQGYVSLPPTSLDDGSYTVTATFAGTPSTYLPSTDPSSGPGAAMAIDTTAPLVTVLSQLPAANGLGWNHGTVTVTWQCTDAGVGGQTCPSPTTVAVDGASQVINSPAVCDQLNNCSIGTTTVSLDTVGPTVVGKQSPAPNGAVWTNSAVTVSWSCTDATSGVLSCPPDQSVSTQGANQTATATGTDKADNSTLGSYGPINIDTIAPTLVGHPTTSANGAGWYNGNVTIQWSCTDAGSGPGVCPANSIIGGEGPGLNTGADLTDIAGNTTHALSDSVSIDQTAPVTTSDITDAWWSTDAIVHLTPAKDLSGVAQTWYQIDTGAWTVGTTFTVTGNGAHTVRFHSVDVAGNIEADQTATVRIDGSVPTITGAIDPLPNGAGWIKAASATVTFTCTAGVSLVQSCSTPVTLTSEGREQSVTGTVVSNAGKSYSTAVKVSIDRTPPVISGAATTLPNGIGWYNSPVTVHFTCTDQALLSGVAACSDDVTLSADGTALSVPGSSTDLAGNTASTSVTGIKIDRTAPTISVSATTNPNAGGWYNGAVTFHFTCFDALSTIATCPVDQTVSADGAGQFATGVAVDRAGNQTSVKSALVKIDSAAPKVTVTGVSTGLFYTTAPKPSCATVDQLSGLGTSAVVTVSGTGGSVTATCSGAVDAAGNAAPSVSVTYLVLGSVKVSANFTPGSSTSNLGDVLPGLNGKSTATITASASYASTGVLTSSVDFVYNITGGVHFTSTKTTSFTINGTDSVITGVGTIAGRTGSFPFQVLLHSGAAPGSGPSRVVVQIFAPTIVAPLAGASATPAVLYQASGNLASTEVHTGRDN